MSTTCVIIAQKWNEYICRADSDRDGLSNGEELGDPDCVWRPGATPAQVNQITQITHPGMRYINIQLITQYIYISIYI